MLAGNYHCRLTNDERNEWARRINTAPEYAMSQATTLIFEKDPTLNNAQQMNEARTALFNIAAQWHADLCLRKDQDDTDSTTTTPATTTQDGPFGSTAES